jgi:hypothetical protein
MTTEIVPKAELQIFARKGFTMACDGPIVTSKKNFN